MTERPQIILAVSDGTGRTAQRVSEAALLQFAARPEVQIERRPGVLTPEQVRQVIREAGERGAMIVHTLVSAELRRYLYMEATSYNVIAVDLMGGILTEMGRYLEATPQSNPGIFYGDSRYLQRVDALDYTIRHDDGRSTEDLERADVILVGVSRTSKTPLSVFLAYRGYCVANIPVVLNMPLPKKLDAVPAGRIVGLVVNPRILAAVRESRLRQYPEIGLDYASLEHVREELHYSRLLFAERGWPVVDVSGKAIEETAREVLSLIVPE